MPIYTLTGFAPPKAQPKLYIAFICDFDYNFIMNIVIRAFLCYNAVMS